MTARFVTVLITAALCTACASARQKAEQKVVASAMEERRYTQTCDELSPAATTVFREAGFKLPSDVEDNSVGLSFSAGGSSTTSSETSTSASFSFGGGAPAKAKEAARAPDAVVNTAPRDGVRKRFACWLEDAGTRVEITTSIERNGETQTARAFDDELAMLEKLQPEEVSAIREQAAAAGDEADK